MLLYQLLRLILLIALRAFFGRISLNGLENVPPKGALIIAANHPSTFLDPIVVAVWLQRPVYFLTNGSVFTSQLVKWLLRQLFMIPIYRQKDSSQAALKNEQTFAACFELLAKGGALLIFPEGSSEDRRELRPLKTGTARIALGALAHLPPEKDVQIVCAGINYTNPRRFQSLLKVSYAPPISARSFVQHPNSVQALTDAIAATLRPLLVITPNPEADQLTRYIEEVYGYQLKKELSLDLPYTDSVFAVSRRIAEGVAYFSQVMPQEVARLKHLLTNYLRQLKQLQISDKAFNSFGLHSVNWYQWLVVIIGFPLYLYSELHNLLPYRIPGWLAIRLTQETVYRAPLNLLFAIFTFGFFYLLYAYLFVSWISAVWWQLLLYLLSLPLSGYFAFHYYRFVHFLLQQQRVLRLYRHAPATWQSLCEQRQQIVNLLEAAKNTILAAS
ncbi:MAG: 1-acyl-sn-glycerol-3-phosphate acyltransferase [Cytophagales bacterium]|nr:1-acyl-sn-glycerol-3-phosphate acyltransferase [Bernardetiaceae bacterium]MDW8204278.1 1-acyl-sn-glycerol-3-phosphate acyltransferase [Cytophagales bacterium]